VSKSEIRLAMSIIRRGGKGHKGRTKMKQTLRPKVDALQLTTPLMNGFWANVGVDVYQCTRRLQTTSHRCSGKGHNGIQKSRYSRSGDGLGVCKGERLGLESR